MLEYVLLGFLTYGDLTGYEIKKFMTQSTSNFVDASFGSIYPALKRLEQKKFIIAYEIMSGKKVTKKYKLTPEGKQSFLVWLRTPIDFSPFHMEFLAKIFFFNNLEQCERINQIDLLINKIEEKLNGLLALKNDKCQYLEGFEGDTLNYGIDSYQNQLKWFINYRKQLMSN